MQLPAVAASKIATSESVPQAEPVQGPKVIVAELVDDVPLTVKAAI
jgi:hypothetical protein